MKTDDDEWKKSFSNALLIMAAVPEEGYEGMFQCPACKMGVVRWARASNRHVHLECNGCRTKVIQ